MRIRQSRLNPKVLLASLALVGCARSDMRLSTEPEDAWKSGKAHPAAYGSVDMFGVGKPQHIRPKNDFIFYFKECEMTDPENDRAFFSKTAYSCTGVR